MGWSSMGTFNSFRLSVCEVKVGFKMVRYASMLSPLGFQTKAEGLDCVLGTEWVATLTSLTPSWALLQYGDGTTQKTTSECVKNVKRFSASPWRYWFSKSFRNWILRVGLLWDPFSGAVPSPASLRPAGWPVVNGKQRDLAHVKNHHQLMAAMCLFGFWLGIFSRAKPVVKGSSIPCHERIAQVRWEETRVSIRSVHWCWDNDKSMFGGLLQIAALETLQRVVNLTSNNFDAHRPHTSPHHDVSCTSILLDQFHLILKGSNN